MDPLAEIKRLGPIECGTEAAKHFAHADGYNNLNQGSYGTFPLEIRNVFRYFQDQTEARPDAFVRYEHRAHLLDKSRQTMADYLKVQVENLVLVANVTTAFDTVFKNLQFQPGEVIVCFDNMYGSFHNTAQFVSETTPAEMHKIHYDQPVSDDHLCDLFEQHILLLKAKGKTPKVAVFDTVISLPALRMPFERLVQICRSYSILSCVDGAHSVGQFPVDLAKLDADFYMSNLHKWLHVPRPCAVLYVPERNQHLLRATVPTGFAFVPKSAEMTAKKFAANFASVGTLDDNPYLCIPAALAWRAKLTWEGKKGEEAIMGYISDLALKGGQVVASILQTETLGKDGEPLRDCGMVNVRLPLDMEATEEVMNQDLSSPDELTRRIMKTMILEHEAAVYVFFYKTSWWVRLCAQVYLTLDDFERAGHTLKKVCDDVNKSNGTAA